MAAQSKTSSKGMTKKKVRNTKEQHARDIHEAVKQKMEKKGGIRFGTYVSEKRKVKSQG